MEFRNLYSFLRVVELGSFTKAAQELGYAQSTITTQIKQLEAEIGFSLFEHIGRRVTLTVYGQQIIPYVNQILHIQELISSIDQTAPSEIHGTLRIGIVESIMNSLLLTNIKKYRECFPNVMIQIYPAVTKPLFEMLRRNEVDLIFAMGDQVSMSDCVCPCSHEESSVFISAPEHPMAQMKHVALADVLNQPMILTGEITFLRQELTKKARSCGIELCPVIQTESSSIIINLVRQNLGISFLPVHLVRSAFLSGKVAVLPITDYELPFHVHVCYHKNKYLTPQMAGMIQLTQEYWAEIDRMDSPVHKHR